MKFALAAVLAATGAAAYAHSNVTIVTEVVESYVTYCPTPTQITHGDKTYTVTEATTLTITDCPCTITKPVVTSSSVDVPHVPTVVPPPPPPHNNATIPAPPPPAAPSTSVVVPPPAATTPPVNAAGKAMAISGAGLAGVMALAAFL